MNYKLKYLVLSVCIILQMNFFSLPVSASDIQEDAANKLYALGLFKGTENGFELNRQPTRTEGLAMFIRLIGAEDEALSEEYPHPFSDVPSWADSYVGYAYYNGLAHGVSNDTFGAQQYMTVEAYTTFILRALGYDDSNNDFTWNTSIEKAKEIGMLSSEEAFELVNKSATRGSMAQLSLTALSQPLKDDNSTTLANNLIDKGVFTQAQAAQYGILKERIKPYLADTLVKAVKLSDEPQDATDYPSSMMTLDKNDNLIYYDRIKNEINRITITGNKVTNKETLLNVNNATYTAVEDSSSITYKDLKIFQIFWDNIKNRLIISGSFGNASSGFFTLENGNLNFFHRFPGITLSHMYSYQCKFILCAMNNGDYVVSSSDRGAGGVNCIWNPDLDTSTLLNNSYAHIFEQNGQDLYIVYDNKGARSGISKYNYASQDFEEIIDKAYCSEAYFKNGIFYLWHSGVTAYKTNGQSKTIFTTSTDVDVKDMTPFPNNLLYFSFVVTTDEKFIFYDSFAKSIRIIYPNPDNK